VICAMQRVLLRGCVARRAWLFTLVVQVLCAFPTWAQAETEAGWDALKTAGAVVLFRHALAPGGGDPVGFVAGDCRTQRNLSPEGKQQAQRIGESLRQHGVKVGAVWHSEWCRTRDTARLAFPAKSAPKLRAEPAFNSFFDRSESEPASTAAARQLLLGWHGPGVLVVVTHQVNITALTGVVPQSGEGVVVQPEATQLVVKGSVRP
jgi:phosphohistidine phosphatase SixA